MTGNRNDTRSVVKERELKHAPEKVWRALTQKHLMEDWLMISDFKPEVGHRFDLEADWGQGVLRGSHRRAAQESVLHLGGARSGKRRHLDPH